MNRQKIALYVPSILMVLIGLTLLVCAICQVYEGNEIIIGIIGLFLLGQGSFRYRLIRKHEDNE